MSATNKKSATSISSDEITAAINMATLAGGHTNPTQNEQASTFTQPTADSTNKHVLLHISPTEPTNKESAPSSTQPTPKERSKLSPKSTSFKPTTAPSNN